VLLDVITASSDTTESVWVLLLRVQIYTVTDGVCLIEAFCMQHTTWTFKLVGDW
jgi:hypothetical protein